MLGRRSGLFHFRVVAGVRGFTSCRCEGSLGRAVARVVAPSVRGFEVFGRFFGVGAYLV